MSSSSDTLRELANRDYKYGFVTEIDQESLPPGLNEDVVRALSAKKNEPEWLTEYRLKAYRHWLKMEEPTWAQVEYEPVDYQSISYYAAPKSEKRLNAIQTTDPEGRFAANVWVQPKHDILVVARKTGLALGWEYIYREHDFMAQPDTSFTANIVLRPPGAIAGRLIDPQGHAVSDADIQVVPQIRNGGKAVYAPKDWLSKRTDAQGRFTLEHVTPGTYDLRVSEYDLRVSEGDLSGGGLPLANAVSVEVFDGTTESVRLRLSE